MLTVSLEEKTLFMKLAQCFGNVGTDREGKCEILMSDLAISIAGVAHLY